MKTILAFVLKKYHLHFFRRLPRYFIILLVIFVVAVFFRFYNTPLRYTIGDDSSRDALVAMEGARQLQLPLTGPFSSLGPFTFGPWYYIQLILFTFLTHLPYAPWIYMGITSVLFVLVMYKVGEELQGKRLGLIVAFFTAITPINLITGVFLSNPWNVSPFAGLALLALIKIVKRDISNWWGFILGVSIGLAINAHYSSIALLVLPLLIFIHSPRRYRYIVTTFVGLFTIFLPLIIFDLNNHWFTFRNILYTYIHMKERIYVANSWTIYVRDFWPNYLSNTIGISIPMTICISILSGLTIVWSILKKNIGISIVLLLIAFCIDFIQLRYYGGERSVSYLQYLQPFVLILFAYPISTVFTMKYGKYVGFLIIVVLCTSILPRSFSELRSPKFETEIHTNANILTQQYPNQKFNTYNCQEYNYGKMQALALLLEIRGKLDSAGMKIGFADERCDLSNIPEKFPLIPQTTLLDLHNVSTHELEAIGWKQTTPRKVHEKTVRWWIQNRFDKY